MLQGALNCMSCDTYVFNIWFSGDAESEMHKSTPR